MTQDPKIDLKAAVEAIDKMPLLTARCAGGTAELLDEEDPEGPVVIKNKTGYPVAFMPQDVFWDLRNYKKPTP